MSEPISIAVDMMGGDFAPGAALEGVAEALQRFGDSYRLLLVGAEKTLREGLERLGVSAEDSRLSFVDAPEVIEMAEHPVTAIRTKRRSSINVAMDLAKHGQAQGVFSAGSTGASVASAFLKLRMLPGLARPGIATALPRENGFWVLMDAGATVDCSAVNLTQFAVMGDLYARSVFGLEAPKVGLLSNGTEQGKGNHQTQDAFEMLKELPDLHFVGNVEGHTLFSDAVDVVICDGFVGNIVLKTSERLAKTIASMLKTQILSKSLWKLGGALCKGAFQEFKRRTDATEVGGAPLLGVNGHCVIGHGNSNGHAFASGIRAVARLVESRINEKIVTRIHEAALEGMGNC